jgi:hypothetical protein
MNRFLQALIAVSGLLITGLLGFQTLDSNRRTEANERLQAKYAFLSLFSQQIGTAMSECDSTPLAIIETALEQLSKELPNETEFRQAYQDRNRDVGQYVTDCLANGGKAGGAAIPVVSSEPGAAVPPGAPSAPFNTMPGAGDSAQPTAPAPTVVGNLELRAKENAVQQVAPPAASGAPAKAGAWYAVLASYKVGSEDKYVPDDVAKFRKAIASAGDPSLKLEVYRTSVSNHFAIVLTPSTGTQDDARRLVSLARKRGWSPDAFAQVENRWTVCADPNTLTALQSCQGAPRS